MFKEVVELIEDIKITEETIFPSFFNSIQLDGAKEVEETHESKNNANTMMRKIQSFQISLRI